MDSISGHSKSQADLVTLAATAGRAGDGGGGYRQYMMKGRSGALGGKGSRGQHHIPSLPIGVKARPRMHEWHAYEHMCRPHVLCIIWIRIRGQLNACKCVAQKYIFSSGRLYMAFLQLYVNT